MKNMSNRICIGSANFGLNYGYKKKKLNKKKIKMIIDYSYKMGINYIDTATSYGNAHKILGDLQSKKFNFVTKLPLPPKKTKSLKNWCISTIIKAKKKLKIDHIYGLLIHDTKILENKNNANEIYEALNILKKKKIINKVGLSIYDPTELDCYFNTYKFQIIQFPFNIFDRRILNSGWLQKLSKKKVELHARSVFLQGLLLIELEKIPKKLKKWNKYFLKLNKFVEKKNISKKRACISFVRKYKTIDKFVIGISDLDQLKENLTLFGDKIIKIPSNLEVKSQKLLNPKMWQT
jgi:aryl-alcohol dehydrogenase-like predicted oxidoreductase